MFTVLRIVFSTPVSVLSWWLGGQHGFDEVLMIFAVICEHDIDIRDCERCD